MPTGCSSRTNSLRQTFNRKVLEPHLNDPKKPLSLTYAIPDHPWVDAAMGAAVRIAMTVGQAGRHTGRLLTIAEEIRGETEDEGRVVRFDEARGRIFGNLRIGADVAGAKALKANAGLAHMGVKLHGMGFLLSEEEANNLGLNSMDGLDTYIKPIVNGRDLSQLSRNVYVIDCFGLSESKLRNDFPDTYQFLMDRVKPERDAKAGNSKDADQYAKEWWLFGKTRPEWRQVCKSISRFVATTRTAKHRLFQFVDSSSLPESKIVAIGVDDAWQLSLLSSRLHIVWSLANGSFLEDRPNYNHSECFNKFPFPDPTEAQKSILRALGEELDAHRKDRQAQHPKLTLTSMYNVLEKLRAGEAIDGKDREIYDQGLIGLLRDIHDRIDAAVAEAYGWPVDLSDDEILHNLVDLNFTRASEEAQGRIRWLRPEYQNPTGAATQTQKQQGEMDIAAKDATDKPAWPKSPPEQVAAVRDALSDLGEASPQQVARAFKRGRATTVEPLLDSLAALGLATRTETGSFRPTR